MDDFQFNQKLDIIHFNKLNKIYYDSKYNSTCAICFEDFNKENKIIRLKCNHNFHIECIKEWLCNSSNCCPLCKTKI